MSYVIPTYNDRLEHLREAVASALTQTHSATEVIVVDDGSSPPVEGREWQTEPRVRVIRQANAGPAAARNAGAAVATGRLIAFLDADDWVDPTHAQEALALLTAPDVTVAVPAVAAFGGASWHFQPQGDLRAADLAFENQIPIGSICRREDFLGVDGFDPELRTGLEDHEFWLRLLLVTGGRAVSMPSSTLHYRIRPGQRSEGQFTAEATDATREALLRNVPAECLRELARGLWKAAEREKALRHQVVLDRLYLRPHYARWRAHAKTALQRLTRGDRSGSRSRG